MLCLSAEIYSIWGFLWLRIFHDHDVKRSKDWDMARRAKLDQMMRTNVANDSKRQASAIEEVARTCLSKEDMIELFCSTIGDMTSSTNLSKETVSYPTAKDGGFRRILA